MFSEQVTVTVGEGLALPKSEKTEGNKGISVVEAGCAGRGRVPVVGL